MLLLTVVPAAAQGMPYDAQIASAWLDGFAQALAAFTPVNEPEQTADPARAGQYLIEYEFGTVLAARTDAVSAQEILEIDVRSPQVTDCRGVRVGMEAEQALGSALGLAEAATGSGRRLVVLDTQEAGYGWSWAYMDGAELYGAEYITYGQDAHGSMKEYTLTYVIEEGRISALRIRTAAATMAQAEEGLRTAEEIASRQIQAGRVLVSANERAAFDGNDLQVMGGSVLGHPVDVLIARMGEPQEIQSLPGAQGRILVYSGAAVRLELDEYTGVEIVRGVSVSDRTVSGPRGLMVGFEMPDAAALFRCDADLYDSGMLYEMSEAVRGELNIYDDETAVLRYSCAAAGVETAELEIGVGGGRVTYWHLYYASDLGNE